MTGSDGAARRSLPRGRSLLVGGVAALAALSGVAVGGPAVRAHAATPGGSFSSSFESTDPAVTADTAVSSSGISGAASCLPGSLQGSIGTITASGDNPPSEVEKNLADCDPSTKWLTFAQPSAATAVWVQYQMTSAVTVRRYELTSANDTPGRDPSAWQLEGSDDGSTWTVLDTQSGQSFAGRFTGNTYSTSNATAYSYYRLNITANSGDADTQLGDWNLSDGSSTPPPTIPMRTEVGNGPVSVWNTKSTVGWTGLHALRYGGSQSLSGHDWSYNEVYSNLDIPVGSASQLSYKVFPENTDASPSHPSTFVAVDLQFGDGTFLRDLGAVDEYGYPLNAAAQGSSKVLYVQQWNSVYSSIGDVAAGKTITAILVDYDVPAGSAGTAFQGWIDDVAVHDSAWSPPAHLSDNVITTRGSEAGGAFSRGNNFPATATPHGFNFLTPMTNASSTSFFYNYTSDNDANNLPALQALEVSHEPSPWMGDRNDVQLMPADSSSGSPQVTDSGRALEFSHANEVARPYYYGVTFQNGMKAEMAPTDHAGMMRFTYTGSSSSIVFDEPGNSGALTVELGTGSTTPDGVVSGYSDNASGLSTGATRLFFYARVLLQPDQSFTGGGVPASTTGSGGPAVTRYVTVDTSADKTVTVEFATSLISLAQAQSNLALEIGGTDTLDSVAARAQAAWDRVLGVITVSGATQNQLTTLYSNLYRLNLFPNEAYENTGTASAPVYQYASPTAPATGQPTPTTTNAAIENGVMYVNNGFWDTYRTEWPLDSWLYPTLTGQMIQGFTNQYRDGGWISRWSSPGYANLMTGTSADDAFTDAFLNGVRDFDWRSTYDAVVKDATVYSSNAGTGRNGLATSPYLGYTTDDTGAGMSWAMAGYASDYGIAQMSTELCNDPTLQSDAQHEEWCDNAPYFTSRAEQYVTMWNPALYDQGLGATSSPLGFFEGRNTDGSWRLSASQYNPRVWGNDYTEADGWTMAFSVPGDPQGLASLLGGQAGLAAKLDQYFTVPECACVLPNGYGGVIHEMTEASQTGIGQYEFNNQPGHAIPYFYDAASQPYKAQAIVRQTLQRMFTGSDIGEGYPGDEDNGEMSSWYILSALGVYPLSVGSTDMAIGSPLFHQAVVHLENGNTLTVNAANQSPANAYVQSLSVNGQAWNQSFVPRSILSSGGELDFTLGSSPSSWATDPSAAPSTLTPVGAAPQPSHDLAAGGTATASANLQNSAANAFDDSSQTEVDLSGPAAGQAATDPYLQYQLTSASTVAMYTITSGTGTTYGDPSAWTLAGSNDGSAWTTLDQRTGESFPWRSQLRAFTVATPQSFTYYRLTVTASTGTASTAIAELELLSAPPAPAAGVPEGVAGWALLPPLGIAALVVRRRRRRAGRAA